jgi:DNA polymerase
MGSSFRVTAERGKLLDSTLAPAVIATVHPSSILRASTPDERRVAMAAFVSDLRVAAAVMDRDRLG